ncbi:MAG: hypothetical protein ABR519_00525 [Bacteroidales bacterium]
MMKRIILFPGAFLLFTAMLLFSGCEKDNLDLLSGSTWDFENLTTTSSNEDIQTLIALGKALMTDGTLEFASGGDYTLDSPTINTETGTWELVGNNQLIFNNGTPRTATIDEISKKKLVYIETYLYLDSETYTVKYTWVK